ncbi:MAG TPA: DUF2630 family protein [Candidatus Limnocylindrales bacterium]
MDDAQVLRRLNDLAEEEERLYAHGGQQGGLDSAEQDRLRRIEVELDQCYDLLAQRRARRAAGLDPDEATIRPDDVVERYQQ